MPLAPRDRIAQDERGSGFASVCSGQHVAMDSKTLILQYLDEAHAMEAALVTNLGAHIAMTTDDDYRSLLERHLEETQAHATAIDRRRKALGRTRGRGPISLV